GSIVRLEFELSRLHNSGNIGLRGPIWGWKFLKLVTTSRVRFENWNLSCKDASSSQIKTSFSNIVVQRSELKGNALRAMAIPTPFGIIA
ncbi:hypothetical protein P5673_005431, partial [Acropora cervicornis]